MVDEVMIPVLTDLIRDLEYGRKSHCLSFRFLPDGRIFKSLFQYVSVLVTSFEHLGRVGQNFLLVNEP